MTRGDAPGGELKRDLDTPWLRPPTPLTFPFGRIDVWRVDLDESAAQGSEDSILSSDAI
jgi:hypothetical protein